MKHEKAQGRRAQEAKEQEAQAEASGVTSPPGGDERAVSRRTFVRWGAQAAVLAPIAGWAVACETTGGQEPTSEPNTELASEPTKDATPTEQAPELVVDTPRVDPQDQMDPQSFDKGTEKTWAPAGISEDKALFPLGVMSGAMKAEGALLWGFGSDNQPKTLAVWRASQESGKVVEVFNKEVTPTDGFFREQITGLAPGTTYQFGFFEGENKRSELGNFKTAWIEKSMKPLVLACSTCTHLRNAPFTSLQLTATYEYDAFVHLGDMSYNDGAVTREQFRKKWQATLKDPGYRAVLPKTGHYITWDDHEITDNSRLYDIPETQRRQGVEAFFENSVAERIEKDRFWTSYRWGHTAEIFVLDSRSERMTKSASQPIPQYISPEQLKWFKDALKSSPCHFKIILNSVPMIDWSNSAIGAVFADDRWQGYPEQRKELLDSIEAAKIENIWWLSGDFHIGTVGRIDEKGYHRKTWEVLVGPGANGPNPAWPIYKAGDEERRTGMFPPTQFEYFSGEFAATLIRFSPADNTVEVEFVKHDTKEVLYKQTFKAGEPV